MRTDLIVLYGPRGEVVVRRAAHAGKTDWAAIVEKLTQKNPLLQDRPYVERISYLDLTELNKEKP